nr:hypothetical protein [Tanacetum cinerariifolium]
RKPELSLKPHGPTLDLEWTSQILQRLALVSVFKPIFCDDNFFIEVVGSR